MYRVEVDWAPAYELLISLYAYLGGADRKIMELGADWLKRVRGQLRPAFAAELAALKDASPVYVPDLLVWLCRGERDAAGFLRWLDALSPGDLYACLAPYQPDDHKRTFRLRELADDLARQVRLLATWDEQYFSHVDPAILSGLAADAAARRERVATVAPAVLIEETTTGIDFTGGAGIETVLLIPQYHYRPWNLHGTYGAVQVFQYPADALPPAPGEPPPAVLRLASALSDESRLRILRFLARGPATFTEVVGVSGLAKSTVHHHLVVLRAAGLVRVHHAADNAATYSLRPRALDELHSRLAGFLAAEVDSSAR